MRKEFDAAGKVGKDITMRMKEGCKNNVILIVRNLLDVGSS